MSRSVKGISRRRVLMWAAVTGGAGAVVARMMPPGPSYARKPTARTPGQIRTGTVVDYSETAITVRIDPGGGAVQDFPYVRSYEPILGEQVLLGADGIAWYVIGALAGMPANNPVTNGGFEEGGGSVTGWGKVDLAGATTLGVVAADPPAEGVYAAELSSAALNVNTVVYSNPIGVAQGQHWSADCLCRCGGGGDGTGVLMILMLTWYANVTNVYPTTAASDSIISSQEVPSPQNVWSTMRMFPGSNGGFVVPAAATHMRVAVQCIGTDSSQMPSFFIDRVVARNIDQLLD